MLDLRDDLSECIFMVSQRSDAHDTHRSVVVWNEGRIVATRLISVRNKDLHSEVSDRSSIQRQPDGP